jgi:MarR family transcriptional regulator, organic hydroperoxide resistance regulator
MANALDFMAEMAELTMASRLRRLSDSYWQSVTAIYKQSGVAFEVKWASVFLLIVRQGPVAVTEIADRLGVTHPAVIQIVNELLEAGLIASERSEQDGRKRILTLSDAGRAMLPQVQPIWDAFVAVNRQMLGQQTHNLLQSLTEMEAQLAQRSFLDRVNDVLRNEE